MRIKEKSNTFGVFLYEFSIFYIFRLFNNIYINLVVSIFELDSYNYNIQTAYVTYYALSQDPDFQVVVIEVVLSWILHHHIRLSPQKLKFYQPFSKNVN